MAVLTATAQQQSPAEEPAVIADNMDLPTWDPLRLFVKLKDQSPLDITYESKTGFRNKEAGVLLKKIVKKSGITSIQPTFTRLKKSSLQNIYTITITDKNNMPGLLEQLRSLAACEYAEPIPCYYTEFIPNDFSFQQPYSYRINLDLAWNITTGSPNVRIAIVDDAVRSTHEDLVANCWTNPLEVPSNGIDDDGNGYIDDVNGYDVSDDDPDANPPASATNSFFTHGTHVAGIAAAKGNNALGIAGVAYQCSYIPVKTKGDADTGPILPDAYLGLEYAIAVHADIINMSWGGFGYSQTYQLLCTAAYDTGIVLVASAGNTGTADSVFPSCYEHVISTGSTNLNDVVSYFSTYGTCIDVMAPGVSLYSTLAGSDQSYGAMSGTSMAAPLVSGICALMLANNTATTPDEVEACLKSSCNNINLENPTKVGLLGSGRVDALGALTCVEAPPRPCIPGNSCYYVCTGHSITFNGSSMGLNATSWYWEFPGGTPATSTSQNPTVTYNIPGMFDIVVVACNQYGCDTVTFPDKVCVGLPHADLSALNTGQVCEGSAAYLEISFYGANPFSIGITDGVHTDTITGINSDTYLVPVFPATNTSYMITFMTDRFCTGTTSGTVTLYPIDCGPCSNTDFEFGNFSTWVGSLGYCCGVGNYIPGIIPDRMEIISGTGNDPYSGGQIPLVSPYGGNYSLKLGNYYVGGEAERMEKSFLVTPDNASLTYEFAVVLEDPIGHAHIKKPKFEIRLLDAAGNLLPDTCAYYQVTAGPETNDWVHNGTVRYQTWRQVTVDLTGYIGQQITVQFATEDCGLLGHFGYAYLDARCAAQAIDILNFCSVSDTVSLTAPGGYVSYQWTPYGDTTQSIVIIAPQDGDTVSVTMRNIAGCVSTITHVFDQLPVPVAVVSPGDSICVQDTAMIWAQGAGTGGTYHWFSSPQGFSSTDDTLFVTPNTTTTYYVTIENSNGCSANNIAEVTVFVDNTMAFELGSGPEICLFDSISLISTAGNDSLLWSSWPPGFTSTNDTITVAPVNPTIYILSSLGSICSFRDSIDVSIYDNLYDNPITQIPVCSGETSVTLSAPPTALHPLWLETGDTSAFLTVYNPLSYAIYSVCFTTLSGCDDTLRFMIDPVADPEANAGPDTTVCDGFSVLLQAEGASTNNGTYTWSSIPPGYTANTQSIVVTPTVDTWYIVTVTNGPGCLAPPSTDTIFVDIIPSPEFELGENKEICLGDSVFMSVNIPEGFNYWQSDPPGFQSTYPEVWLKPETTTTYYLTVNTSICTFSDQFTIEVFSTNGPNDTADFKYCPGDSSISINASEGYAFYYWPHSGETSDSIEFYGPLSDTILFALMKDSVNPCSDTCVIVIKEFQPSYAPVIIATDSSICNSDTLHLSVDFNPLVSYLWTSFPSGLADSSGNAIEVIPTDTTTYYCTTTEQSCHLSDTLNILWYPKPYVNLPSDTIICIGDTIHISLLDSMYYFLWTSVPPGFADNDSSVVLTPLSTTTFYLEVSSDYCSRSDSITITVMQSLVLPDTLEFYYCPGDSSVNVEAPANYDLYFWTELPDTAQTIIYTCIMGDSLMMILLGDSLSPCFDTCMIRIEERDFSYAAEITASDTVLCAGETLQLSVPDDSSMQYIWTSQPPVFTDSGNYSIGFEPDETTVIYCQAQHWNCISRDSIKIEVFETPSFVLPEKTALCPGDGILIDPEVVASAFLWSDGDTTVPRWLYVSGEYELTATNGPCIYSGLTTVDVMTDSSLIVPNVFTPNGDHHNDLFEVIAENSEVFNLKIYNRWGKLLFESDDPLVQWDGAIGGASADAGVYFYICRFKSSCNQKVIDQEGFFHLLR